MTGAMEERDGERHGRSVTMRHVSAIQALAETLERPIDEIAAVYQCELVQLGAHAVVTDFLPVLVAKRVRRLYQRRLEALDEAEPSRPLLPPG